MEVVLYYVLNRILGWVNKTAGRKFIGLDECWELFAKDSAVDAIEGLYRKGRKEGAAIWTITQSPLDYESNDAGKAIKRATHWNLVLEQKADAIEELLQNKHWPRYANDLYFARMLRDTKTHKGKFSEIMIISDSGYEKVRHYLNPFMLMVYNTEQEERDAVFTLMNEGVSAIEAVERVAKNFSVSRRRQLEHQVRHLIHNRGYDVATLRREVNQILAAM
jgi:conjugal transfer ATP-binding protein TraC